MVILSFPKSARLKMGALLAAVACSACTPLPTIPAADLPGSWSTQASMKTPGATEGAFWARWHDPLLVQLIQESFLHNRTLKEGLARIEEAQALAREAGATAQPQVGLGVGLARDRQSETGRIPLKGLPNPVTEQSVGVNLSWELDLFGRLRAQREGAVWQAEAGSHDLQALRVSLASEIAQYYMDYRGALRQRQALHAQSELAAETVALLRYKSHAGLIPEYDRLRAETLRTRIDAQRPLVDAQIKELERVLGVLVMGRADGLIGKLPAEDKADVTFPTVPARVPAALLERRADVLALHARLQAARSAVEESEAAKLPSIEFSLRGGYLTVSGNELLDSESRQWRIGPRLNLPILNGSALASRAEAARARYEQLTQRWLQAAQTAVLEVERSSIRLAQSRHRLATFSQSYDDQKLILQLSKERFNSGISDFGEVLDAGRQLLQTQLDLIDQQTATQKETIVLYKALGGDWDTSVIDTVPPQ
ncbi:MAG: TolC family protein [Gammaproteobacteria bacterium]|nr:TolC family protein [Gammaproteobacteria bacterium]